MSRSSKEVGGYRGRRTVTDILKFIAAVLAVLVVLAIAGLFFLQRYIVYTDDGPKLELPPFLQMFRQNGSENTPGSASLPNPGNISIAEPPDTSQTEPQPPVEVPGFALSLPVQDVIDGTAGAKLEQAGAEALILEMKDQEGKLAWLSGQATAGRSRVNGTQAVNDALTQWNAGEVYTVARLSCFRDNTAPYYNNGMALRQGNGNWRDELGLRWLSPAEDRSQAYIAGLCGELAAMGFDEIVLEQFTFPVQGKVENITRGDRYDPAAFTARLEAFLTQVQAAVEPYGTKISLRVEAGLLENPVLSGLTPQLLEQFSSRFWTDGAGLTALSAMPAVSGVPQRTVEITAQAAEDRTLFQAVIPPAQ